MEIKQSKNKHERMVKLYEANEENVKKEILINKLKCWWNSKKIQIKR